MIEESIENMKMTDYIAMKSKAENYRSPKKEVRREAAQRPDASYTDEDGEIV